MSVEQRCIDYNNERGPAKRAERSLGFSPASVAAYHLDNIAHIGRFAKLNPCKCPATRLQCHSGRDIGHCPDKCRNVRSKHSLDPKMELDRVYRGHLPNRLGSSMFVRVALLLSPGSKPKWRRKLERA